MSANLVTVETLPENPAYQLQSLSERHKLAAALLAQGLQRKVVAEACKYEPEYITWLTRQPVFKEYLKDMLEVSQTQLEALFAKSVEVIADTLDSGSEDGKLKAAKLQLEATNRIGKHQGSGDKGEGGALEALADRLVNLLHQQRRRVIDGQVIEST